MGYGHGKERKLNILPAPFQCAKALEAQYGLIRFTQFFRDVYCSVFPCPGWGEFFQVIWEGFQVVGVGKEEKGKRKEKKGRKRKKKR